MFKLLKVLMIVSILSLSLGGCSYETVPQGTKGKLLGVDGFEPEVYPPSKFWVWRKQVVLAETVIKTISEPVTVRMADDMNLESQVSFQLQLGNKKASNDTIFNEIIPDPRVKRITLDQAYAVFGKLAVNRVARAILSPYKTDEVRDNFNKINADIYAGVKVALKSTPLVVSDVALGKLKYPKVVDDAIEAAAKRNLEIEQEKADVAVQMTKIAGQEKVADGQYRIKLKEAKRIKDYNTMIAKGITPALLKLRELEVQEAIIGAIQKGDVATFVVPYGSMNNVGVNNRVFNNR